MLEEPSLFRLRELAVRVDAGSVIDLALRDRDAYVFACRRGACERDEVGLHAEQAA
jgi:hypothetical protein